MESNILKTDPRDEIKPCYDNLNVGVITPSERNFRMWVDKVGRIKYPNGKFIRISRKEDCFGLIINLIEGGLQWWKVDHDCVEAAYHRVIRFDKMDKK